MRTSGCDDRTGKARSRSEVPGCGSSHIGSSWLDTKLRQSDAGRRSHATCCDWLVSELIAMEWEEQEWLGMKDDDGMASEDVACPSFDCECVRT